MKPWLVLLLLLGSWARGELQIRDYYRSVKVTRVRLDSMVAESTYYLDADGDGKVDSLLLGPDQVGPSLVWKTNGEKAFIAGFEIDGDENVLEFAVAYVVSLHKPVLVVKLSTGIREGYRIWIADLVRTARGPRVEVLLDGNAGAVNAKTTVVKPNVVESVHFRGMTVDRYVWDGAKFVEMQLDE